MRRNTQMVALCCLALLAAGCISYQQNTTFAEDGSGRIVVDTWLDYYGTEEDGAEESNATSAAPDISEELGPAFADLEGVKIEENWTKVEGEGDEKREHTHLVLAFDKVETLNGFGVFKNQQLSFENAGPKFVFTQVIRNERADDEEEASPESEELARTLFEGYTFTYTLTMPGNVSETNGTLSDDGRTVTWEWPLYDFSNQEEITMTATSSQD
jgi:hypothetical protein